MITEIFPEEYIAVVQGGLVTSQTLLTDMDKQVIEPTVLTDISWDDSAMEDEIFGPILPILDYSNLTDVIKKIYNHPKPLAFYLFTESSVVS